MKIEGLNFPDLPVLTSHLLSRWKWSWRGTFYLIDSVDSISGVVWTHTETDLISYVRDSRMALPSGHFSSSKGVI